MATEKQIKLARFWRKYLRLTRAGVPVLKALHIIEAEDDDEDFSKTVASLLKSIEGGNVLSDALRGFPEHFSLSCITLIETAEKRGAWDEVLQELSDGLEEGTF